MSNIETPIEVKTQFFAVVFDQFPCHNEQELALVKKLQEVTRRIVGYESIRELVTELEAMVPESMEFKAFHFYDQRIDSNVISFQASNREEIKRTIAHFFPLKED
jgi:hypothetical protein